MPNRIVKVNVSAYFIIPDDAQVDSQEVVLGCGRTIAPVIGLMDMANDGEAIASENLMNAEFGLELTEYADTYIEEVPF